MSHSRPESVDITPFSSAAGVSNTKGAGPRPKAKITTPSENAAIPPRRRFIVIPPERESGAFTRIPSTPGGFSHRLYRGQWIRIFYRQQKTAPSLAARQPFRTGNKQFSVQFNQPDIGRRTQHLEAGKVRRADQGGNGILLGMVTPKNARPPRRV